MNNIRRIVLYVTGIIMVLALGGCGGKSNGIDGNSDETKSGADTIADNIEINKGYEMIALLKEMVLSESYNNMIGTPSSIMELREKISGFDYDKASAIYLVEVEDDFYDAIIQLAGVKGEPLSGELAGYVDKKYTLNMSNQLNSKYGVETLAASSIYSVTDCMYDNTLSENVCYLYVYDNAYPVLTCFVAGEDGAVMCGANYIMDDEMVCEDEEKTATLVEQKMKSVAYINLERID